MKVDGHIHTPFCPHGSKDSFEQYIENAISLGYERISFTEHAPLPAGFHDSTPTEDSGMELDLLKPYIQKVLELKEEYKNKIEISVGLEVDYIEGFEEETKQFLNEYGPFLDDSILSVHFLKKDSEWYCLDYSPDLFNEMISTFGSVEAIYEAYYQTVLKSIRVDLGEYRPKRIGHITLVRKFQKKYPVHTEYTSVMDEILNEIKKRGFSLDYNGAGVMKPFCGEPYPSNDIAEKAKKMGIPLVYGSDAHQAKDLHQGRSLLII
ncbi:histidinol-phosphatase (PHP family) [Oikeobacillus pervagus]|uniref:Histidinol-phosphatase n=1 Tax=Oikeobacillus pervagus TaxID=1325931 RepID=A0AAJ1T323_9BACI|nr:histidinol-phosphatase HisJ [Oikeobacillus pervagus]MDQ0215019.1 histidinol-phosphatase (PHP family) [Oikeobacillus pervagus]